jgi:hypothetical protein
MGESVLLLCYRDADFFWDGFWVGVGALWALEWRCVGFGTVSPLSFFPFEEIFDARANEKQSCRGGGILYLSC